MKKYEKCHHGYIYWAYLKISLNGYNDDGQFILTENDKKFLDPLA